MRDEKPGPYEALVPNLQYGSHPDGEHRNLDAKRGLTLAAARFGDDNDGVHKIYDGDQEMLKRQKERNGDRRNIPNAINQIRGFHRHKRRIQILVLIDLKLTKAAPTQNEILSFGLVPNREVH